MLRVHAIALLLACLWSAGCSEDLGIEDRVWLCSPEKPCAAGYVCVDHACVSAGFADATAGTDGSAGVDQPSPPPCVPSCTGKQCGDDGCGGGCGACSGGAVCNMGECVTQCTGTCESLGCGCGDVCGQPCGTCGASSSCDDACHCSCQSDCTGKQCGSDGCGGTCGDCPAASDCDKGKCVTECSGTCDTKQCECGEVCGDPCGDCPVGKACADGCHCSCAPSCGGKTCGADGCGGTCGQCSSTEWCSPGGECLSIYCTSGPCPPGLSNYDGCNCKVPPTGVTMCSNGSQFVQCSPFSGATEFEGQDGMYYAGAPSAIDQGDGTVKDSFTGVLWSEYQFPSAKWDEAKEQCEKNLSGLNGTGWRLPEIEELLALIDYSRATCPMWSTAFGWTCPGENSMWSNTYAAFTTEDYFKANFAKGWLKKDHYGFWMGYRCARGELAAAPSSRYFDAGGGTVSDSVTGLVWVPAPACSACSWGEALKACASKGAGWRLPNVKELISLLDFSKDHCPAWADFMGPSCPDTDNYWSSTPAPFDATAAYQLNIFYAEIDEEPITAKYGAICVRNAVK